MSVFLGFLGVRADGFKSHTQWLVPGATSLLRSPSPTLATAPPRRPKGPDPVKQSCSDAGTKAPTPKRWRKMVSACICRFTWSRSTASKHSTSTPRRATQRTTSASHGAITRTAAADHHLETRRRLTTRGGDQLLLTSFGGG